VRRALILAALLAVAVAVAPAQGAQTATPIPLIGIGEQNPAMFANPYFGKLNVKYVRVITAWDSLRHRWSRADLDNYMYAARAAGVRVLLGFGHARSAKRKVRRYVPSVKVFTKEFLRYKKRYPWVKDWLTWNEANHCGEPTCHKAHRVARFYNNMRHRCFGCNVVGADVLDTDTMVPWVKEFKKTARKDKMIWGLHNYLDANRMRTSGTRDLLKTARYGQVWFTETGGVVKRTNRSRITFPENRRHAAKATKQVFRLARLSPRVRRIYFYQWMPSPKKNSSWDSALVDRRGKPRPAYKVLATFVHKFARMAARRKAAAEREQNSPPAVITARR
jgi:polysaccharide biosynthesis protein PslG